MSADAPAGAGDATAEGAWLVGERQLRPHFRRRPSPALSAGCDSAGSAATRTARSTGRSGRPPCPTLSPAPSAPCSSRACLLAVRRPRAAADDPRLPHWVASLEALPGAHVLEEDYWTTSVNQPHGSDTIIVRARPRLPHRVSAATRHITSHHITTPLPRPAAQPHARTRTHAPAAHHVAGAAARQRRGPGVARGPRGVPHRPGRPQADVFHLAAGAARVWSPGAGARRRHGAAAGRGENEGSEGRGWGGRRPRAADRGASPPRVRC